MNIGFIEGFGCILVGLVFIDYYYMGGISVSGFGKFRYWLNRDVGRGFILCSYGMKKVVIVKEKREWIVLFGDEIVLWFLI